MTNLFEHTPIPHNSSTSPVENLADEVSLAFSNVENYLLDDKNPLPGFAKVLGSFLLKDLKSHGRIAEYSESITVQRGEQHVRLKAEPVVMSSVSYLDSISNKVEYLEEIGKSQTFTNKRQYKTIGKNLYLSGVFNNVTILVQYRGISSKLGNLTSYGNTLTLKDGTHLITPSGIGVKTSFKLKYDTDIQANTSELFKGDVQTTSFVFGLDDDSYVLIPHSSLTIANDLVTVFSKYDMANIDKAFIYITNISVSELLENMYLDYINHTHSPTDAVGAVDHNSLINTYCNTERIFYKDVNVENYQHPQFFNREGYNPNLPEIYDNAILGDILLSSSINNTDQAYKSLTKNSYSILFGDPVAGSKLYYDGSKRNITLASGATVQGLNINFTTSYAGLSFNNTTKFGETNNSTYIKGKEGVVEFTSDPLSESLIITDNLRAKKKVEAETVGTTNLEIGTFIIKPDGDNLEVTSTATDSYVKFNRVYAQNIKSVELQVDVYQFEPGNKIRINDTNYLTNYKGEFSFISDKGVNYYSSGLGTGISVGQEGSQYNILTAGEDGKAGNKLYVETPKDGSVAFIRDTSQVITKNGTTFVFNQEGKADVNITELRQWLRADIEAAVINGDSLKVKGTEGNVKNGIKIGTSNLFVLGETAECPTGITVFESVGDFHLTKNRSENDTSCTSLQYQTVNVGDIQSFGDITSSGEGSFLGNLSTSGDIVGKSISVDNTVTAQDLELSNNLKANNGSFLGTVETAGNIKTNSDLEVKNTLSATNVRTKNLEVEQDTNIGRSLSVAGNLGVLGSVTIEAGFKTNGPLESDSLTTGKIQGSSLELTNGITSSGATNLSGPVKILGNLEVQGNENIYGSVEISQELTAKSLYIIADATVDGRLTGGGNVEFTGENITLGREGSNIVFTGGMTFNTPKTTLNGSLSVLEDFEVFGKAVLNSGVEVKGEVKGTSLVVDSTAVVNGAFKADSGTFERKVILKDGLTAEGISEFKDLKTEALTAKEANMTELYIKQTLNMGADSVIKASRLETSSIIQVNPAETSSFVGPVTYSNEVEVLNSLVIGNKDIKSTRDTSGIHITDSSIKMGNNSSINAVKIFAGKGAPRDGDLDRTGGYCFQSPTSIGTSDGDTGMFATLGSGSGTENSDLQFYIDGTKKGEFVSSPFNLPSFENTTIEDPVRAKYIITYDMLLTLKEQIKEEFKKSRAMSVLASYPIGTVYTNSRDSRNPSHTDLLGTGVWLPYAPGRVIVGLVSSEVNGGISDGLTPPAAFKVNVLGTTYGEFVHEMTEKEMFKHNHAKAPWNKFSARALDAGKPTTTDSDYLHQESEYVINTMSNNEWIEATSKDVGNSEPFNIVQPTIIAARWERIA